MCLPGSSDIQFIYNDTLTYLITTKVMIKYLSIIIANDDDDTTYSTIMYITNFL